MGTVMTNTEFVNKLIDVAQNYKTLYVMGCFGAPMTSSNKQRYTSNHSYNKRSDRTAMINAASSDTFGFDCVCLIKGILWGWNGDQNKIYGGASYAVNGVPDIGADYMIQVCSGVSTNFSNIEPGEAVWMEGHIGVYIGNGLAVECTPAWSNKVQITAVGNIGSKSGYNTRTWTKHGKLPYIKYESGNIQQVSAPAINNSSYTPVSVKGIDVSTWQGEIDWAKVKASGIKFAMIRLGYGSHDGNSCGVDKYFEKNVANAVNAGIDIGCYFYSYAKSIAAVKKEAEFVVSVLNKHKGVFTYPIAFDLEDNSQIGLGKDTLTNMVITFGNIIEGAGFYSSLYSNLNWLSNYLDDSKLTRFDHWLAQWASAPTYKGSFGIWQNSCKGSVNGINGDVDTNIAYIDYPSIIKSKKLNGFTSDNQSPITNKVGTSEKNEVTVDFKIGDIVNFKGTVHYASANASSGYAVKSSKAKITAVCSSGKHPYHCRAVNDSGTFISGVYGWVNASDVSAVVTSVSAPGTSKKSNIESGDTVKIIGSKYYTGADIPSWVKSKNWIVLESKGDRVVVDKSADGKNSICSPIKLSDVQLVSKK